MCSLPVHFRWCAITVLSLSSFACRKSEGPAFATGTLMRGPLPAGYTQRTVRDDAAKEIVQAGGIFLTAGTNDILAVPAPALEMDLTVQENCQAFGARSAQLSKQAMRSAGVISVGSKRVCLMDQSTEQLHDVRYAWNLDPSTKLGVLVTCTTDQPKRADKKACLEFVGGLVPVDRHANPETLIDATTPSPKGTVR